MRLLIVDDHPVLQEILGAVARSVFEAATIDFAKSLKEALQKAHAGRTPDLTLLDLGLPDSEGIETLVRFRKACRAARVVVISAIDDPACVVRALEAGAAGYLPKTSPSPVISAALRLVAAGGKYVPPQALQSAEHEKSSRAANGLTDRQIEVLRLIAKGHSNKEIAHHLKIAEDTVKHHVCAIYAALSVSSRTQVMIAAARRGINLD